MHDRGAKNALLLGAILVIFGTIINMLGVKIMARINNFGVIAELIGASILVVLLIFHFHRGPGDRLPLPRDSAPGH